MLFPPATEFFDLPAQLLDQRDVCARQVIATGGHPIFFGPHSRPHDSHRPLGLTDLGGPPEPQGLIKPRAAVGDGIGVHAGLLVPARMRQVN